MSVKLITPVELLYVTPVPPLTNPLTCESLSAKLTLPLDPPPVKPLPALTFVISPTVVE